MKEKEESRDRKEAAAAKEVGAAACGGRKGKALRSECSAVQWEGGVRAEGEGPSIIRKLRNVFTHANTCLKIIRNMHSNKAAERA